MKASTHVKLGVIEKARLRMGLTRTEFASHCGISAVTRTKLFRDDPVSMRTVRRIASAIGSDAGKIVDVSRCMGIGAA